MFNFVHSSLTKNLINLGGVLSCVMAFNLILFHNCDRILADEADNSLIMWGIKIFRAPFTVKNSSFMVIFSFLGCRYFMLPEIITKNKNLLLQNLQNKIRCS